jgi:hypothetical protein
MLFAHYCYLIGGALSIVRNHIHNLSQQEETLDSKEESVATEALKCDNIVSTVNGSNDNDTSTSKIIERNSYVNLRSSSVRDLDVSRHSTRSKHTDDLNKSQHRLRNMQQKKSYFNDSENIYNEGGEVIIVKKNNSASNWKTELMAMEIFKEKEVAKDNNPRQLKRRQSYVL